MEVDTAMDVKKEKRELRHTKKKEEGGGMEHDSLECSLLS